MADDELAVDLFQFGDGRRAAAAAVALELEQLLQQTNRHTLHQLSKTQEAVRPLNSGAGELRIWDHNLNKLE